MTAVLLGLAAVIVLCLCALVGVLLRAKADPYVPEAAEAPDAVDEHFKTAPRVVAGSDIDRQKSIERTRVDIVFGDIVADTLADLDAHLSAYYVTPEGDR